MELTPDQVAALPKSTIISRLRFIPKTDGMRPITRVIGTDAKTRVHFDLCHKNIFISTSCIHIHGFIFPAALSKPHPGLAGYATCLCALHTIVPGIHSVGDDRYPQSVKPHSSSPEGEATDALFCESLYFFVIGKSSLLYLNYYRSV